MSEGHVGAAISAAAVGRLLRPASVAIVGASPTPGALGASVLANLEHNGYTGRIHLINPKRTQIDGRPCLATVDDLPEGVDVAVLAIPQSAVLETVRALARRKAGAAVIFSAGFAEGGAEGMTQQREIARIAAEAGMVIEGPNCLGCINYLDRIPLTFIDTVISAEQTAANRSQSTIAFLSQSGAMMAVVARTLADRALPMSFAVSTGNEAGSTIEDYLEYALQDPATRVLAMFAEQFRSPRRLLAAAQRARELGKIMVLLHPGKSSAARESAATHTGAMAGDYQVMRAKVERAGIVVAETLEELGDIAEIALRSRSLPTRTLAVVGESGAFKALSLDLCEELGLELPVVHETDSPELRKALPPFVGLSNPLDLTAQGLVDPDLYRRTLVALLGDERFSAVVIGVIQRDAIEVKMPPILQALRERPQRKPVVVAGLDEGAKVPQIFIDELRALGAPYFPTTERVLRALRRLSALSECEFGKVEASLANPDFSGINGVVPEYRSKKLLSKIGVPFAAGQIVTTVEEAVAVAKEIGYPVALKAQSPSLSHKSDAGGVVLGLDSADSLLEGWHRLAANITRHRPGLVLDGVLVEAMGKRGLELIVGARNDPQWGAVVLVGFGGVTAEITKDTVLLPPDLPPAAIIRELEKLKNAPLLHGYRGSPALDLEALAQMVSRLGLLVQQSPRIREVDLNPVILYPRGEGIVALDALMLLDPGA
ncbi:MAG: acetate--CoA ligase family protein [Steroidobacteraceae bacterium]